MCNENRQGRATTEASNAAIPSFRHARRYSPPRPYGRRGSVSPVDRPQCRAGEAPIVVFSNACSNGRHGPELKERLHQLIAEEQMLAWIGDSCAKDTRESLGVVVTVPRVISEAEDAMSMPRRPTLGWQPEEVSLDHVSGTLPEEVAL
ncbi:hypothetical protein SO802_001090 [Lithocarpus litseifolius]|uniref:Uncharacterized protein n=1 Tax=Lithocarpus litseifolius TaxID=425828 RepID=A0AAW2DUC2_9ROSI